MAEFESTGEPKEGVTGDDLERITVFMDLERLGELIAAVAHRMTVLRGIDPPDFDGEEMRDLAVTGWRHVCMMADRAEFTASVMGDLEKLDSPEVSE